MLYEEQVLAFGWMKLSGFRNHSGNRQRLQQLAFDRFLLLELPPPSGISRAHCSDLEWMLIWDEERSHSATFFQQESH